MPLPCCAAQNDYAPATLVRPPRLPAGALEWVVAKEHQALELLHGQSDLSSWYFIESGEPHRFLPTAYCAPFTPQLWHRCYCHSSTHNRSTPHARIAPTTPHLPPAPPHSHITPNPTPPLPALAAEISGIQINVTVSLTSRLLTGGLGAPGSASAAPTGAFNRALGASGFQLVNVGNVPIVLGKWMVGNDPSIRWAIGAGVWGCRGAGCGRGE